MDWISVDEELPSQTGREYLVAPRVGSVFIATYNNGGEHARQWLRHENGQTNSFDLDITHWMELPAPPSRN